MIYGRYIFACAVAVTCAPALVFAFIPNVVEGQVVISEVMYDLEGSDTSREWVEVFNAGSSAVTLTEWKLFEADTNHGLAAHTSSETLSPGAYAIIADNPGKFLEDWPAFSGLLFDSAFSLSNTGEALVLRCCGSGDTLLDKDSVSYDPAIGAAGDGNSLHRTSVAGTSLAVGAPTPGSGNLQGSSGASTVSDSQHSVSVVESPSGAASAASSASLSRVNAGNDRIVNLGVDIRFEATAYAGSRTVEAQYRWNFGDGTTAIGQSVLHRWDYPGKHAVVVEATRFGEVVSDRIIISVEYPHISLNVLPDGGVGIENLSNRDLDISLWRIADASVSFVFPPNTIVLKHASVRFSLGGLRLNPNSSPKLFYPNGTVAVSLAPETSEDSEKIVQEDSTATSTVAFLEKISEFAADEEEDSLQTEVEESATRSEEVISKTNSAQVAAAAEASPISRKPMWWLGILLVVGLGGYAVFATRRLRKREWTIIEDTSE